MGRRAKTKADREAEEAAARVVAEGKTAPRDRPGDREEPPATAAGEKSQAAEQGAPVGESEIENFFRVATQESGGSIGVHRLAPWDRWLGLLTIAPGASPPEVYEQIRATYGGGTYRLWPWRSNGQRAKGASVRVTIEGNPRTEGALGAAPLVAPATSDVAALARDILGRLPEVTTPAPAPQPVAQVNTVALLAALSPLLIKVLELLARPPQPSSSLQDVAALMGMIDERRESAPADRGSKIEELVLALLASKLGGEGPPRRDPRVDEHHRALQLQRRQMAAAAQGAPAPRGMPPGAMEVEGARPPAAEGRHVELEGDDDEAPLTADEMIEEWGQMEPAERDRLTQMVLQMARASEPATAPQQSQAESFNLTRSGYYDG